jgi:hypothetical protein
MRRLLNVRPLRANSVATVLACGWLLSSLTGCQSKVGGITCCPGPDCIREDVQFHPVDSQPSARNELPERQRFHLQATGERETLPTISKSDGIQYLPAGPEDELAGLKAELEEYRRAQGLDGEVEPASEK